MVGNLEAQALSQCLDLTVLAICTTRFLEPHPMLLLRRHRHGKP